MGGWVDGWMGGWVGGWVGVGVGVQRHFLEPQAAKTAGRFLLDYALVPAPNKHHRV